ncbi:MAG TPA: hypothetical protein VNT79_06565 [Phycisphaerae bacterium]|nr:hypothetical protein [Phycisphaerae bacterium]
MTDVAAVVIILLSAVTFLVWIHQVVGRLRPLDREGKLPRRADAVIGLLVPLFHLYWLPALCFRLDRVIRLETNAREQGAQPFFNLGYIGLSMMLFALIGALSRGLDRTGILGLLTTIASSCILTLLVLSIPKVVQATERT